MFANQTFATVNDLQIMTKILHDASINASLYSIVITIFSSIAVGLFIGLLFQRIANKEHNDHQNIVHDHRKQVKKFILSRLNRIQGALDRYQQNLDSIDAGRAPPGVTKENLNIAIWRDVLQTNYKDIRFVSLSNFMEMPLDVNIDMDELGLLLHTNPLKEEIIATQGIDDIDKILKVLKDLAVKLD